MRRMGSERIKEQYYVEGYVIKWRGLGLDDEGQVNVNYIVVDEDNNIVGNFSVQRRDIKRREDVTYAAKRALGLFPEAEEPSLDLTRAETAEEEPA
jgi:hypothetical protein